MTSVRKSICLLFALVI